ncbi:hypothetical protein EJD96_02510 [Herbaspirillum seropedicae]|uniref:DUF6402 family protein n=1 Tax=Herbaspirillum seropedicae TaxID=964 RepID=UPI00111CB92F|nr:DUF6402 family protein [Herbaspirillum seropedicae]QDD63096.1 hypothetical protein EJD96_02510 [Herbaspirillum seropedicae]
MAARKLPYYRMESSLMPFRPIRWQHYAGSQGCVPLATQRGVSLERPAPGATPLPPPPPPPPESRQEAKARKAQERLQKRLDAAAVKKQADSKPPERADGLVLEECKNPPVFDLQDIPGAMEKMGWPVSAKLARSWFAREKHIYNNDPKSVQPIDDVSVTLDWALGFSAVRKRYVTLLKKDIYSSKSLAVLGNKLSEHLSSQFKGQERLGLDTRPMLSDLHQLHTAWQFQLSEVSDAETLGEAAALTDLTGALAHFSLFVAVAIAHVSGEKYFCYDNRKRTKTFCMKPSVEVTHVFVYIRDNYSFNDNDGPSKSQYLGHWNKSGAIITLESGISQAIDGEHVLPLDSSINVNTGFGSSPQDRSKLHSIYLTERGIEVLVDTRRGTFRKYRDQDIYYPIYNKNYNAWREKHNRGGDFMIYTKPRLLKLDKPIQLQLQPICRPPEPM